MHWIQILLVGLLTAHSAFAEEVKYLALGRQSLAEFLALTQSAKKSIDLATFIFEPCHASTQILMNTLAQKVKEGVRVRLLLDTTTQSAAQKQNIADEFAALGIQVRFYNDFSVYSPLMNLRMHVKVMVVDNQTYISGGRNISDEYFDISTLQNWVDRDAMVSGPSAAMATASFNEIWESDMTSERQADPADFVPWNKFCPADYSARVKQVSAYFAQNSAAILAQIPSFNCTNVKFVTDNPEFGNPRYSDDSGNYMSYQRLQMKRATNTFLHFLAGTKKSFKMENWSYIPIDMVDDALADLRARNIPIEAAINLDMDGTPEFLRQAEEYSNNKFATRDTAGSEIVRQLASEQIADRFDLTPANTPFMIHSKIYVRDAKDTIVSSYNLDPRSYATNLESLVVVKNCPAFAREVTAGYQTLRQTYDIDEAEGRHYEMEHISAAAIFFAYVSMELL